MYNHQWISLLIYSVLLSPTFRRRKMNLDYKCLMQCYSDTMHHSPPHTSFRGTKTLCYLGEQPPVCLQYTLLKTNPSCALWNFALWLRFWFRVLMAGWIKEETHEGTSSCDRLSLVFFFLTWREMRFQDKITWYMVQHVCSYLIISGQVCSQSVRWTTNPFGRWRDALHKM